MKANINIILILTIYFSMVLSVKAESPESGNNKIKGTILDTNSGLPVEYATIALVDPKTDKPVNGNIADGNGEFVIDGVEEGVYRVTISFIGFESQTVDPVLVSGKKTDVELGIIHLSPTYQLLNDVIVQSQRDLIEEKVDRTIYNAENDLTAKGGDATDVLNRVPMLAVDMDGNVSLRGSQNIKILINNKPSIIAASSVADALKQIPADQIKSVEVITSPSAKYDAEGSAGIINIITKKNTMEGAMLSVRSGTGLRGSNLGINGSLRKGKIGFSLGGFGRAVYNVNGSFSNSQLTNLDGFESLTEQQADTRSSALHARYTLGFDYDINKNNFVIASVQYGVRNAKDFQDGLLTRSYTDQSLLGSSIRDSEVIDESTQVDVSLDYIHMFEKPQQEWSVSTLYSTDVRSNDFLNTNYGDDQIVDSLLLNLNASHNQEFTIQTDYQTPIKDKVMMELGVKQILRRVTSDYTYYQADGSNGDFVEITNPQATNVFDYQQNVSAAYLSYTVALSKSYTLKAGARYEYTNIQANFQNPYGEITDIPSYGLLVPSINISKKMGNGNFVKMAFNRRIQRPSIQFLNPNIQASNPSYITVGNPNLSPEFTNNYEISYSTYIKNSSINIAAFVRNTTGSIQRFRSVIEEGIIMNTYANIGEENAYGLNLNGNVKIGKSFSVNGGTDIYYVTIDNNHPDPLYQASNQGWVATARLRASYKLPKGWEVESFMLFRGRQIQLQGAQSGFRTYNVGLQKEFANEKGTLGFGVENFLTSALVINSELVTPEITQNSTNVYHNLSFKINFDYRIGDMSFDQKPKKKRKSVKNDDLKVGPGNGE